jgi:hypothetical protein
MRTGRWLTGIGSVILFLTAIGHEALVVQVQKMIVENGIKAPMDAILKASWLAFGGEMVALAVIAMVANWMVGGGRIILLCAATMIANASMLFHFMGLFFGVYVSVVVGLLFLAGGWLQSKQPA